MRKHPLLRQWAEVQKQLRLNKIYQGLRCEESRPRYVFNNYSRDDIRKMQGNRKYKAIFVPGHGIKYYRPIFGSSPETYYVKNGGNDGLAGTSDALAWETLTKVNATALSAGDIVHLKCGSSWTNGRINAYYGGSEGSPIIYTKYGEGALPLLVGSAPSGWVAITDYGSSTQSYITVEYIEIKDYDDQAADGRGFDMRYTSYFILRYCKIHDNVSFGAMIANCDYSEAYGNEVYNNATENGLWFTSGDYLDLYDNICYRNGSNGIGMNAIDNSKIHHNTCYQNSWPSGDTAGIGAEVGCENNEIYYNLLYEDAHAGLVLNASYNEVYNNTFFDNADAQLNLVDWSTTAPEENTIKNNIFYFKSGSRGVYLLDAGDVEWIGLNNTFDYNLYCLEGGPDQDPMVTDTTQNGTVDYTFATWVSSASKEANGQCVDPQFVNAANDDYRLQSNSPCLRVGVDVSLTEDLDGNTVPQGYYPDIGAYEYMVAVIRRGRGLSEFGQAFTPLMISGGTPAAEGQPYVIRGQGVPTMQGYRDRIGKWNVLVLPLLVYEALRQLIEGLRGS